MSTALTRAALSSAACCGLALYMVWCCLFRCSCTLNSSGHSTWLMHETPRMLNASKDPAMSCAMLSIVTSDGVWCVVVGGVMM